MPIYEYRCGACGFEMDHFHRTRSEAAPLCRSCGMDALEKLVSLTSFQLKGEGWYVTDYKANGRGAARGTEGKASSETAGSESAGGESTGAGGASAPSPDKTSADSGSSGTSSEASKSKSSTVSSSSHAA